ncbi:MAG TPA: polyphosphate kinase 1 [Bryobacteraceae bacterium]|jgi:polyphosphate kinase|nr:polyphosphate kinase 1 [Bryobacteraceae bacterium]
MPTDEDSSTAPAQSFTLEDPRLFQNRELSLLSFQERVLKEAEESSNPLLERLNFLSIFASNIDEFFMVRVAGLKQKAASGIRDAAAGGMSGTELLDAIRSEVIRLTDEAYRCLREDIRPELERAGIMLVDYADLDEEDRTRLNEYFQRTVFLVLAPLAFDPGRPFPHISNLSLNLAVVVQDARGEERFARVKIPDTLPQLVPVHPREGGDRFPRYVWLEQLIIANLQALFPGLSIKEAHPFRVTRDAETSIQELESDDLLETIEEAVWRRRFRSVVRLQVDTRISAHVLEILTSQLELQEQDVYLIEGPLDLRRLRELYALDRPDLKYKPFLPYTPPGLQPNAKEDIFTLIRGGDVLLHHPFESFQPVVEFIRRAARDPEVLAIKITLYRVGRNSPIVQALLEAVEEGKQVSVLLELKARFDEESNIEWAKALEREGVHVIYGLVGLKVHCKIALVVRREGDIMRRYVHMGTGNYNPLTARMYTDLSLFTCDEQIGADATDLFNYLTGYSAKTDFRKLLVAPVSLRRQMEGLILREIEIARHGGKGHLIFKMNALEDPEMIKLLYRASQAGVQVDLLVRGLCCLRPGIRGVSDRIRVTSIIGRFLEHSRIYYFRNGGSDGGKEEIYLGSADLMLRNLNHRIEIVFPVESPSLVQRIRHEILEVYLADTVNAYQAQSDGSYKRASRSETAGGVDSQQKGMTRRSSRPYWNDPL